MFKALSDFLWLAFVFSMTGLGIEVIFTSFCSWKKGSGYVKDHEGSSMGYTHPDYIVTYTVVAGAFFFAGHLWLSQNPALRFAFYSFAAFFLEYGQNLAIHLVRGVAHSEKKYRQAKWNLHGFVRWPYPFYFGAGAFLFEALFIRMQPR